MKRWYLTFSVILLSVLIVFTRLVSADPESAHYQFIQSKLGGSGLIDSNSTNFQSTQSIGDAIIGNSGSSDFQFQAGHVTTGQPSLSFGVSAPTSFGNFSPTTTATATSTFTVSNYTSYGYIVQITGTPPTNGPHVIAPMATTATPTVGTEQFGINLVANTLPSVFGANPDHGQFGVGSAVANYNTPNQFRYVSGDVIASAPKTSGITTYTISYIADVSPLTPGGQYTSNQSIICTATY